MIENKKEFKLISKKNPKYLLPNALTIFGVCLGLSSIKFALDSNYAMAIIAIGFAATIAENGAFSAAASLSNEGLVPEAISMLTLATTAGGYGTAILALGIGLLGYSLYKSKTIHPISSCAFILVGIYGLIGSILFYDEGLIAAYYFGLTITSVATGIELIRTAKD